MCLLLIFVSKTCSTPCECPRCVVQSFANNRQSCVVFGAVLHVRHFVSVQEWQPVGFGERCALCAKTATLWVGRHLTDNYLLLCLFSLERTRRKGGMEGAREGARQAGRGTYMGTERQRSTPSSMIIGTILQTPYNSIIIRLSAVSMTWTIYAMSFNVWVFHVSVRDDMIN